MKKIVLITTTLLIIIGLIGCSSNVIKKELDYTSENKFEEDLNARKNLEGKTVLIKCSKMHPQTAYGYDIWAGKHLNFISSKNSNVSIGDEMVVKPIEITSSMKSRIIKYEKLNSNEYNWGGKTESISKNTEHINAKVKTTNKIKGGNWAIQEFVDDFKMPTGEKYVTNVSNFKGYFSNSVANNEDLYAKIVFEQFVPCILLYTYRDAGSPEKSYNNKKYNIKIRDAGGNIYIGNGIMLENGDRVIFYDKQLIEKLIEILYDIVNIG